MGNLWFDRKHVNKARFPPIEQLRTPSWRITYWLLWASVVPHVMTCTWTWNAMSWMGCYEAQDSETCNYRHCLQPFDKFYLTLANGILGGGRMLIHSNIEDKCISGGHEGLAKLALRADRVQWCYHTMIHVGKRGTSREMFSFAGKRPKSVQNDRVW